MKNHIPSHLSDEQLIAGVMRSAGSEREATAELVGHLAELDARRLHLAAGFSSLFKYCCEVLHLSEHETYNRIEVARLARRFPLVLDLLEDGSVNLTTLRLLAPHLTNENQKELLAAATHRSKREVEELVARHAPRPDLASSVRKLPVPRVAAPTPPPPAAGDIESAAPPLIALSRPSPSAATEAPTPPSRRPVVAPLAPDRYEVKFTVSAATREKLRRAQDLLRHSIPTGDPAEIFDRALTLLLEDVARKRCAATSRPRAARGVAPHSRHVAAEVARAVWLRDEERCAFIGKNGRRCNERGFLELHHVKPYGALGESTVDNIELRCRRHNQYESELFYAARKGADGGGMIRETAPTYGRVATRTTRSGTSRKPIAGNDPPFNQTQP